MNPTQELEEALRDLVPPSNELPPSEYAITLWVLLLSTTGGPGRRQRSDAKLEREADKVYGEGLDRMSPRERLASVAATAFELFSGKSAGRSVRWSPEDIKPGGAFHEFLRKVFAARGVKANIDYQARTALKNTR